MTIALFARGHPEDMQWGEADNGRQERAEEIADRLMRHAAPEFVQWIDDTEAYLPFENMARMIAALLGSEHDRSYAMRAIEDMRVRLVEDLVAADRDYGSVELRRLMGRRA